MPLKSIKISLSARAAELVARNLILKPTDVPRYLAEGRFEELAALAEYVQHDVPSDLAATDMALYRSLRKGITELTIMGFGNMNAAALRNLVKSGKSLRTTVPTDDDFRTKQRSPPAPQTSHPGSNAA